MTEQVVEHTGHNRRRYDRFDQSQMIASVQGPADEMNNWSLVDFSIGGCRVLADKAPPFQVGQRVTVSFKRDDGKDKHGRILLGRVREQGSVEKEGHQFGVVFDEVITPENCPRIARLMVKPSLKIADSQARFLRQKEIAQGDVAALHAALLRANTHLFTLFVGAVTLSISLAGLYFAVPRGQPPGWLPILAVLPGSVFVPLGAMVLKQVVSIQKLQAFLTIVQRSLAYGHFPPHYRGWRDANEGLRHSLRWDKRYGPNDPLCAQLDRIKKTNSVWRPRPSPSMFLVLGTFLAGPMLSNVAFFSHHVSSGPSTLQADFAGGVVAILDLALLVAFFWALASIRKGRFSYEFYLQQWVTVLEYLPPYSGLAVEEESP